MTILTVFYNIPRCDFKLFFLLRPVDCLGRLNGGGGGSGNNPANGDPERIRLQSAGAGPKYTQHLDDNDDVLMCLPTCDKNSNQIPSQFSDEQPNCRPRAVSPRRFAFTRGGEGGPGPRNQQGKEMNKSTQTHLHITGRLYFVRLLVLHSSRLKVMSICRVVRHSKSPRIALCA